MSLGDRLSMFPRLHASTCFAVLPVIAAIALANLPGEYFTCGRGLLDSDDEFYEHGWPCTWLVRQGLHGKTTGFWDLSVDVCRLDAVALSANLGLALLMVAPLAAVLEWRRRRRHRIWQFTLADVLLATLAVGWFMTWYAGQRRNLTRCTEIAQSSDIAWYTEPAFPSWVREAVGDERLATLGILRPERIEFDLPGADPARDDDMAAIRAIVDCYPEQVGLSVPQYSPMRREPFLGADYLRTLPRLRHLVLERADDEVFACLESLRELRTLIIEDERAVLSPAVAARLTDLRELRHVRAPRRWLGDTGVISLGSLNRLEMLSLDGANDRDLANLARLRNLRCLELRDAKVSDVGLASLAALRRLERLTVHSTRVTGGGFNALDSLPRLHTLDLAGSGITDNGLVGIGGLQSLRFLNLQFTPLTGTGLRQLAALRHVRSLRLATTELGDRELSTLPKLPRLEFLDLSDTCVTGASLGALNSLAELRELSLSKTKVASLEWLDFDRLSRLERLDIDQAWVPDIERNRIEAARSALKIRAQSNEAALSRIATELSGAPGETGMWIPEELDLRGPSFGDAQLFELEAANYLKCIRLGSSRVSDAGLARLAQFHDLEGIDLHGTSIGDAGLSHLGALPRLKYLDIAYTKVTDQGLKRLTQFPALVAVGLDPSQIDASAVSLLQRDAKFELLRISRLRAPWGKHYCGAADFEEFVQFLRRDLPTLKIHTSTRSPDGFARFRMLVGCGF